MKALVDQEEESGASIEQVIKLFDIYQTKPGEQGTRFVRTEEAILINMAALYPVLREIGFSAKK